MEEKLKQQAVATLLDMFPNYHQYFHNFDVLKDVDLTKTQLRALFIIAHDKKLSMGQLAEKMCISREQASRAIAPLTDRKFILRSSHPDNRRQIDIELSEEGKHRLDSLKETYLKSALATLDHLSAEELSEFLSAIKTVMRTLEKITQIP